ncbi:hypothetical protein CSKR_103951 [Clonorchis sinensis]|uniref:Uncharacterized protein n=1 Tax=Clonorchis sinensis TaxID=79923 RepID=A0A3R7F3E9_CLOSI|nr:hypothetical protein CSKR_103951 [Clonorchis sinensis]
MGGAPLFKFSDLGSKLPTTCSRNDLRRKAIPRTNYVKVEKSLTNNSVRSDLEDLHSMHLPGQSEYQVSKIHSFEYQFGFDGGLTCKPAESLIYDVFKQLSALHQAASCFSWYDI